MTVCRNEWKYVADLEMELELDLPMVPCLRDELNQTMLNIIVNASHAIGNAFSEKKEKGKIKISTRKLENEIEIQISDNGGGIPSEIKDRIFDPFFTTKDIGKGTGQGLAIAHTAIVDKHNGTLNCESEIGVGTKFTIKLPLVKEVEIDERF